MKNNSNLTSFRRWPIALLLLLGYSHPIAAQPACVPPPSGLVSWWRAENNASDQHGTSPGTTQGNVAYAVGKVGTAFRFDGASGLVALGNNSPFRQSSAITYLFWVRLPSSAGANAGGQAMGVAASGGHGMGGVAVVPTAIAFSWTSTAPNADTAIVSAGLTLPTDEWFHLAVSVNFSGQSRAIYVNGQPVATTLTQTPSVWTPDASYNSGQADSIGGRFVNSQLYFNGDLDEVDVYSRALDAAEVLAIYNAGAAGKCTGPPCVQAPTGLIGWWRGENNASDAAGANYGTLQNGATFAPGKAGQAFTFDGVDDYLDVGSGIQVPGDLTIVAWIKTGPSPLLTFIAGNRARESEERGWELLVYPDGRLVFQVIGIGDATGTKNLRDNQWHHVVAVREGADFRVYVDGLLEGQTTGTAQTQLSGTPTFIGKTPSSNDNIAEKRWKGLIDEFAIFNRALAAAEIAAIFNAGSTGLCPPAPPTITCPANLTEETTELAGKVVSFNAPTTSPSGNVTVVCVPPSGSTFPLGTTTVNCTATDSAGGSASCSFTVTVSLSPDSPYVYFTDFENGLGAEWSSSKRVNAANFTWFSGNFGNESQTLTLNNLVAGKPYALDFDLYVLDSWDGVAGPDYFNVAIDGTQRFHETFSNYDGEPPVQPQTYPGLPEGGRRHLGMGVYVDAIYRKIRVQFTAGSASATLTFSGQNLQDLTDESWGIDNVTVKRAVEIDPISVMVPPGGTTTFTASSGQPPYTFAILNNPSHGSIEPSTGIYTASTQCGAEDTVRVTDAGATTADALILVVDILPPIIACPPNIIAECTGPNGTIVTFPLPTATDDCDTPPTVECEPRSRSFFASGVTTVNCTATDVSGNTVECSFTVTVRDTTPPTIVFCATDRTMSADTACQAVIPDLRNDVVALDACGPVTITQSPATGTRVGLGPQTITLTVRDGAGNESTCTTTVTVRDTTLPVITACAPNQIVEAGANCLGAVPDVRSLVTVTDECGPVTLSQLLRLPGTLLELGLHTITVTATDAAGNFTTCVTELRITDTTPPVISACSQSQTLTAGANCQALLPDLTSGVVAADLCGAVTVTQNPPADTPLGIGHQTVTFTATDRQGNMSTCTTTVTIVDTTPPVIMACAPAQVLAVGANCQAALPDVTSLVTATEGCRNLTVSQTPNPGTLLGIGSYSITVTVTDEAGNADTCDVPVVVRDSTPPVLGACPANLTVECAGPNGTVVTFAVPDATDNCGDDLAVNCEPPNGSLFSLGTTTVTCRSWDASANLSSCQFTVTVRDTTPPVITSCAPDQFLEAGVNCQAALPNVTGLLMASDTCGPVTVSQVLNAGTLVGLGTHSIAVTVRDESGNIAICTVNATVRDTRPPVIITCPPSEVTLTANDIGCLVRLPDFTSQVVATDLCGPVTIRQLLPAGMLLFPFMPPLPISITVEDSSGNKAFCNVLVTVVKGPPKIYFCPPNQILIADATHGAALPNLARLGVAYDFCAPPSIVVPLSQSPPAGTRLGVGQHTVTFTATGESGETATCTALVTVRSAGYKISGIVRRSGSGVPVPGESMRLLYVFNSRSVRRTITTGANGRFSFSDVPHGSSGAYFPLSSNYRFSPSYRSFQNLRADATGDFIARSIASPLPATGLEAFFAAGDEPIEPQTPLIAGLLLDTNGLPLIGAAIDLSGDVVASTNTTTDGEFLFEALPADGTFTVAPGGDGRVFDPASLSFSELLGAEFAVFVEQPLEPLPMPTLSLQPDARFDGAWTITWPSNAQDYILESTPSLADPQWELAIEQQLQAEGQTVVPFDPTAGQRFFRLRNP